MPPPWPLEDPSFVAAIRDALRRLVRIVASLAVSELKKERGENLDPPEDRNELPRR